MTTPQDDPMTWLNTLANNQTQQNTQNQQQQQNNNQNQQNNNNNQQQRPPSRFGGSSNRFNRPAPNNQNQQGQTQNQNAAPAPLPGRNNNNNNSSGSSRFGARNPFRNNQQLSWVALPTQATVVRFDLRGLGDPFYRLLNHDLNQDYGDSRAVAKALENGADGVEDIKAMLDEAWASFDLVGGLLVYNWNAKQWKNIATPTVMPKQNNDDEFYDDDDEDDQNTQNQKQAPVQPVFKCLRSIDLLLVLNVLARARSQIILANAPLVLSQQYLNRSLVTDDPRLIALVKATGYLEEGF